jgi:hypothetical protein
MYGGLSIFGLADMCRPRTGEVQFFYMKSGNWDRTCLEFHGKLVLIGKYS